MHQEDIIHRDIKPENLLLNNVHLRLFRIILKSEILDALYLEMHSEEQLLDAMLISVQSNFLTILMDKKSTPGVWEFWPMKC